LHRYTGEAAGGGTEEDGAEEDRAEDRAKEDHWVTKG